MPTTSDLTGQARVIQEIKDRVDAWRGFALGMAGDAVPGDPPRYEPCEPGDEAVTGTTMTLLQHWFRQEPHTVRQGNGTALFKYWPHQRRLVETFIYLHEVRRIRRTEQMYELAGVDSLGPQRDPWTKLGGQLATGSGKTKMMSLLIAWAQFNAQLEDESKQLGIGRHAVLIAPGLFVRDRLLQDFRPAHGGTSIFQADPVIPPDLDQYWNLKVYDPATCPQKLDPREGALVVTNFHQLLRSRDDDSEVALHSASDRQAEILFGVGEPEKLEAIQTPLIDRFTHSRGLVVINDEAHHVWDETGHAEFEQKAQEKAKATGTEEANIARGWIRCIRRLNGNDKAPGRVALQVDLSATLFEETGAKRKPSTKKVQREAVEFKPADLFRHTTVLYSLADAIRDGIVKHPILEHVKVANKRTGEIEALVRDGQANAWEKYRNLLVSGIERWKKVRDQLSDEGDPRKPILFILCGDRKEAREVANFISYGKAVQEDLSAETPTGYRDGDGETLFIESGAEAPRSTVIEIHIGEKEESNEEEWEHVRQAVNAIDANEIPAKNQNGEPIAIPNPYNVVVSVLMLREGWDVRNVKVIVPLRPCDSRTLTEQALGRGLRKMHAPQIQEDGGAEFRREDLYVIEHPSFETILDQIKDLVERKDSSDIDHSRDYIAIPQKPDEKARQAREVRLVRFDGLIQTVPEWRKTFDFRAVPDLDPRLKWLKTIDDTQITTYLTEALSNREREGLDFTLQSVLSFRDFDHVLEAAFAIPILRELRAAHLHKTAVKGVVQQFLERKTFALPAGLPLAMDRAIDEGDARIVLGNIARPEVIAAVRKALLAPLQSAITAPRKASEALLTVRHVSELMGYQALKKNFFDPLGRSSFDRVAAENPDELNVAFCLEAARDVEGWVYNHRSGVGYAIEYLWQGYKSQYFPDFVARALFGAVRHNFVIEVKGRLDDRDKAKARAGEAYCELLSEHDGEPWHYLLLVENGPAGREDVSWWSKQSSKELHHVLRRHESLALYPEPAKTGAPTRLRLLDQVRLEEQFTEVVPVYDLAIAAGGFSTQQAPEPSGWVRLPDGRAERRLFVARVNGRSMEPAVASGSWALFRSGEGGLPAKIYDNRRVLVELRDVTDPETGGRYTLKRLKIPTLGPEGEIVSIDLCSDNRDFAPIRLTAANEVRIVAELVEIVPPVG